MGIPRTKSERIFHTPAQTNKHTSGEVNMEKLIVRMKNGNKTTQHS